MKEAPSGEHAYLGSLSRLALVGALTLALASCCLPNEEGLRERFHRHRPSIEKILTMAKEDSDVIRIAVGFTWLKDDLSWPRSEGKLGFPPERWMEYRQLFQEAGLEGGVLRQGEKVFFLVETCGIVGSGRMNGYVYSQTAPEPLLRSLRHLEQQGFGFVPLEGDWYLFAERD